MRKKPDVNGIKVLKYLHLYIIRKQLFEKTNLHQKYEAMKIKLIKTYNVLITALLGLLGFATACDLNEASEYGSPSAKYIITGKVSSSKTNQPIEHIRVTLGYTDTCYTDVDGNYQVEAREFPLDENDSVTVNFNDCDSIENGEYTALDTSFVFRNPVFTGGNGKWYRGQTTKEVTVKLEPKE